MKVPQLAGVFHPSSRQVFSGSYENHPSSHPINLLPQKTRHKVKLGLSLMQAHTCFMYKQHRHLQLQTREWVIFISFQNSEERDISPGSLRLPPEIVLNTGIYRPHLVGTPDPRAPENIKPPHSAPSPGFSIHLASYR